MLSSSTFGHSYILMPWELCSQAKETTFIDALGSILIYQFQFTLEIIRSPSLHSKRLSTYNRSSSCLVAARKLKRWHQLLLRRYFARALNLRAVRTRKYIFLRNACYASVWFPVYVICGSKQDADLNDKHFLLQIPSIKELRDPQRPGVRKRSLT